MRQLTGDRFTTRTRACALTLKREPSGKWYAIFSCEVENKPIQGRLPAVGVDFGLNNLVSLSDGTTTEAPKNYIATLVGVVKALRIEGRLGARAYASRLDESGNPPL